jgi:hypothetical protein
LPLEEIAPTEGFIWARGTINVVKPGKFTVKLNEGEGVRSLLDGRAVSLEQLSALDLPTGTHVLAFAIDSRARKSPVFSCEIDPAASSTGEWRDSSAGQ